MHTNYKIELDHFSVWAICVHRCTINTLQKILILYSSKEKQTSNQTLWFKF